jgi:hypothetical protein
MLMSLSDTAGAVESAVARSGNAETTLFSVSADSYALIRTC